MSSCLCFSVLVLAQVYPPLHHVLPDAPPELIPTSQLRPNRTEAPSGNGQSAGSSESDPFPFSDLPHVDIPSVESKASEDGNEASVEEVSHMTVFQSCSVKLLASYFIFPQSSQLRRVARGFPVARKPP